MATIADRLRLAAAKDASLMDAISASFAQRLAVVVRQIETNIVALTRTLPVDPTQRLVSDQAAIGRAVALRMDLVRAIRNGGYGDLVTEAVSAPFDDLAQEVLRTSAIAARAAVLTATDERALGLIQQQRATELLSVANDAAMTVSQVILNGVVGAQPKDDLIASLADVLDNSFAQAHTIYDTAVSIWARQVDQLKASGDPDERFLYVGPVDKKTRPFCLKYVGQVLTRATIDGLDNGQLPNVLLTGGGYNCRHQWKRVTRFDAELTDLAPGARVPEIQHQVDDLRAAKAADQVAKDRIAQARNRAALGLAPLSPWKVTGEGTATAQRQEDAAAAAARVINQQAAEAEAARQRHADMIYRNWIAQGANEAYAQQQRAAFLARMAAPATVPLPSGFGAPEPSETSLVHIADVARFPTAAEGPAVEAALRPRFPEGWTYDPRTGLLPTEGYVVSAFPDREQRFTPGQITPERVQAYLEQNWDLLSQPGHFFGGWYNPADGLFYLDVSQVVVSPTQAEAIAREAHQLAYFNLATKETIEVPQITPSGGLLLPGFAMPTDPVAIAAAQQAAAVARREAWTVQEYIDAYARAHPRLDIDEAEAVIRDRLGVKDFNDILDRIPTGELKDVLEGVMPVIRAPAAQGVLPIGEAAIVPAPVTVASSSDLGGGVNETRVVQVAQINGVDLPAPESFIWKPESGETSQRDSVDRHDSAPLWQREVMAKRVDDRLGTGLMVQTFAGTIEDDHGMLMKFVEDGEDTRLQDADEATRMVVFDLIIGNTDRHGGNLMRDPSGQLVAIDHGYSFPAPTTPSPGNGTYGGMTGDEASVMGLQEFRSVAASWFQVQRGGLDPEVAARLADAIDTADWNGVAAGSALTSEEREALLERAQFVGAKLRDGTLADYVRAHYVPW